MYVHAYVHVSCLPNLPKVEFDKYKWEIEDEDWTRWTQQGVENCGKYKKFGSKLNSKMYEAQIIRNKNKEEIMASLVGEKPSSCSCLCLEEGK